MKTDRQSRTAYCQVYYSFSNVSCSTTMMNNFKIDTELLICTIQNKKCIWDTSCEEYKNRDMKNNAYKDVATVVVQDFDTLTKKEQNDCTLLVQKRWKTARDAYVRDRAKLKKLKSGDAAKTVKKYIYFENLKFLDKTIDLNVTESSLTCDKDNETCAEDNLEDSTVLSHSENDEEMERPPRTSQTFTQKKRKKKETVDDKLLQFLKDSEDNDRDDHKAFLISLLPTLRSFDECQTLKFRSEVLRIVMELKNIKSHPMSEYKSANASNPLVSNLDPPSRTSSSCFYPMLSPTTNSDYSNPSSSCSFNRQLSSANDTSSTTYRPTLLQLSGTELQEMQYENYGSDCEQPFS